MAARKKHCYDYPRPAVTADVVAFAIRDGALVVAFVRRKADPFAGMWALPGGFLEPDEPFADAAAREFFEETGARLTSPPASIGTFAEAGRDPRGWTISMAHVAVFRGIPPSIVGRDDAAEAIWCDPDDIDELAFDHDEILDVAFEWLVVEVKNGPAGLILLPENFNDRDVAVMFEALGAPADAAILWRLEMQHQGLVVRVGRSPRLFRAKSRPALPTG